MAKMASRYVEYPIFMEACGFNVLDDIVAYYYKYILDKEYVLNKD